MRFDEFLKAKGLAPTTISYKIGLIRHLELRFNLWDSEIIKEYIRNYKCSGRRKNNISYAYRDWCAWKGFEYVVEKCKEETPKLLYIPSETELDQLIAGFGPKYSVFLQLLKARAL